MIRSLLRRRRRPLDARDEGTILALTLGVLVLASLFAVPLGQYAMTMARASNVSNDRSRNVEAAKAGLRVALADPVSLYHVCGSAGLTVSVTLAAPTMEAPVTSSCYLLDEIRSEAAGVDRFGAVSTLVGSTVPAGLLGNPYPGSGASPAAAWQADTVTAAEDNKIWLPDLPQRGLNFRAAAGHAMPVGYDACLVYFPGTYTDPVTITSSTPTYFTSGTYYFEDTVRISGNAKVVFGSGTTEGCTTDQEAAFYATDAPTTHNISGLGVTLVFGDTGRLVIDTATAGTSMRAVMNRRYVAPTDIGALPSAGVSIMTVNGSLSGGVSSDLAVGTSLAVPKSMVGGSSRAPLEQQNYVPSTLIPTTATPSPIVDISLTDTRTVTVDIPGYVSIPQGGLSLTTSSAAAATNKDITIDGGVLAAQLTVSATRPAALDLGLVNPVLQRVLKIVSVSTGSPGAVSTAVVQVNENGAYAVNSWEVQ